MKRIIFSIIAAFALIACSKEGNTTENYLIDYTVGKDYTQTFFVGSHSLWASGDRIGASYYLLSTCQRVHLDINPDFDIYDAVRPPQEMYNAVIRKNEKQQNSELKYYAIADLSFTYGSILSNVKRLSDWSTVIGKEEEYIFNGNIFKRIVIVEKVDLEY